jgi:chemosensory pili system protein ChpC
MADASQIKCVILTLRKVNVLMPNALVADIISVKDVQESADTPEWFLGNMIWRGADVPLLSFEAAAGMEVAKVNLNTQAVVLYAVGNDGDVSEHPYMGLVMSGVPHVSYFSNEQIKADDEASAEHPMVAQKVRINGASVSILDVDAMVDMVSELAIDQAA